VAVTALDAATILTEMRRGALDGAWLAEPWATRLVREVGAVRLVDERDLWPDRVFPTALVVARGDYGREHAARMAKLGEAMGDEIDRARRLPDETRAVVGDELRRLLGKRLPDALLAEAWGYVDFTRDPLLHALDVIADDATTLGLAPPSSHATLMG
jgi:NitT/TauT family transport system substrate-binding protein